MPRRSICAEIGVHEGDFSAEILRHVQPARLHLIDPWKHQEGEQYDKAWYGGGAVGGQAKMDDRLESVKSRFRKEIAQGRIVVHRSFSSDAAAGFKDGYFDWIYIDGNHLYEFVKQDLELYEPKVKSGGYLTGDDYGNEGWWDNGVQKAVDAFVESRSDLSLEVIGSQFVIKKELRSGNS